MDGSPNPWGVLHDDSKSYITLATALLGVTATFGGRLLSDDTVGRVAVVVGWVALALSIVFSIGANGKIFTGLRTDHDGWTDQLSEVAIDRPGERGDSGAQPPDGKPAASDKGQRARYNRALKSLNLSISALLVGTSLLAFGAWRTSVTEGDRDALSPTELAREAVAEMVGADQDSFTVEALEKNAANDFTLVVRHSETERFEAVVDGDLLEVISVRQLR